MKTPTNGKCDMFINAHCSYDCPNAALEAACARWDLDPSDFGMERTDCKDCYMNDDCCTCEDCYMQYDPEYCPKKKEMRE